MLAGRGLGADRPLRTAWCIQLFALRQQRPPDLRPCREHVLPFKRELCLKLLDASQVQSACLGYLGIALLTQCVLCTLLPGHWPLELPPCLHLLVLAKVRAPEEYIWATQQNLAHVGCYAGERHGPMPPPSAPHLASYGWRRRAALLQGASLAGAYVNQHCRAALTG